MDRENENSEEVTTWDFEVDYEIELYDNGASLDVLSKSLHMSIGEVRFILRHKKVIARPNKDGTTYNMLKMFQDLRKKAYIDGYSKALHDSSCKRVCKLFSKEFAKKYRNLKSY